MARILLIAIFSDGQSIIEFCQRQNHHFSVVKSTHSKSGRVTSENVYVVYNWQRWAGSLLPVYRAELLRTKAGILVGYLFKQPKIRTIILTIRIEDCFQNLILFLETFKQAGVEAEIGFRLAELRAAWWTGKNSPVYNPENCGIRERILPPAKIQGFAFSGGAPSLFADGAPGRTVLESEERVNNTGACQSCHISPESSRWWPQETCPGCHDFLAFDEGSGLMVCRNPDCDESKFGGGWPPRPR